MVNSENLYSNVAAEVLEVLKNSSEEVLQKIPNSVIDDIEAFSNKGHHCELDLGKSLEEQQLLPETLDVLAGMYIDYCGTEEEKKEYYSKLENESEVSKIQNVKNYDEMFSKSNQNEKVEENKKTDIQVIEEISWFKKIINKIFSLFRK